MVVPDRDQPHERCAAGGEHPPVPAQEGGGLAREQRERVERRPAPERLRGQLVFDDQYISSGGQLYELTVGHDRMLGDIRPQVYTKLGYSAATLCCHPYDVCTALIAREAGCIIETPEGRPLRLPLDTTTPVTWIGYANATLARLVRPVLRRAMEERLG